MNSLNLIDSNEPRHFSLLLLQIEWDLKQRQTVFFFVNLNGALSSRHMHTYRSMSPSVSCVTKFDDDNIDGDMHKAPFTIAQQLLE
jgi:hypothetical protein